MTRIPSGVAKVLHAPGQALDMSIRAEMEERFGHAFGQVRIHSDAEAAQSAHTIRAQAYTLGRHIVMGQGRYQPHTTSGLRLLAHELTHVVQQGNPAADTGPARAISQHHDPSEREADQVAGTLAGSPGTRASPGLLQRQEDDVFSGGGGASGGGGSSGTFGPPTATGPALTRPNPFVCSRPLDFPAWTGLRNFRHAYINDPPANYAIRGLKSGNGVTTSCSTATNASGPPDEPATSICKVCQPAPGQTLDDLSNCLRDTHAAYPSPNLYRNLPDPNDGWQQGPNSNSYAAAMARCCYGFSPAGLGVLPGWSHSPAGPCPTGVAPSAPGGPGGSEGPVPEGGQPGGMPDAGAPDAGPKDAGLPGGTLAPGNAGMSCAVASGPTYIPSGTISPIVSNGVQKFPFRFEATFKNQSSAGILPSCCWVRQYIKWDQRYVDSRGGPPHSGFPPSAPVDTWIEDRDEHDKRYGHRSGPHADPIAGGVDEYTTNGVRDQASGDTYNGKDAPQASTSRTGKWQFRLDVVDTCNSDAVKASSSEITVNFG